MDEQKLVLLNAKTKNGSSLADCAVAYGRKELLDHLLDKCSTDEQKTSSLKCKNYKWL